jgi:predicted nucleotidyltransferase
MFTPEDRTRLRDALIAAARADPRIAAAALTGSAAVNAEDRWSDIDLALSVAADADREQVVADWTKRMYRDGGAVHHLDVHFEETLFRVFLLKSTLQVDLAFWPATEFGAIGPTFQLLFGTANQRPVRPPPAAAGLIGMGWLYALHARSSIERGRAWQAEYMISGLRDQVLALACLRHGVPAVEGRGIDRLPPEATAAVAAGLVRSLDAAELRRAFGVVTEALIAEIKGADAGLAARLAAPLRELSGEGPPRAASPNPALDPANLRGQR